MNKRTNRILSIFAIVFTAWCLITSICYNTHSFSDMFVLKNWTQIVSGLCILGIGCYLIWDHKIWGVGLLGISIFYTSNDQIFLKIFHVIFVAILILSLLYYLHSKNLKKLIKAVYILGTVLLIDFVLSIFNIITPLTLIAESILILVVAIFYWNRHLWCYS